jgi:predicted TIM-barrel fold metal-dependent hydrolase
VVSGPLDVVERWRLADPQRIMAAPYFEGTNSIPLPDISILTGLFETKRLTIMGEIGAQYGGLAATDPKLAPYFALAERLDIPVGFHTGLGPPGTAYDPDYSRFRTTLGDPRLLEDVLIRHPKLRIYIMHAGWPYIAQTKALMQQYPQLYADIAVINWVMPREEFHEYLRALVRAGYGKRLMFGTDQMFWPEAIGVAIANIESATFLTAAQKRDIFYNNAARFLRLDEKAK